MNRNCYWSPFRHGTLTSYSFDVRQAIRTALVLFTLTLATLQIIPQVAVGMEQTGPTTWSPFGPRTKNVSAKVFGDPRLMTDAFLAGQLDLPDWPIPESDWAKYAANPDFLETLPQNALELFEIDFNHNSNFLGVPFQENRGTDSFNSPSTKQPTQAGIEVRRGIAHLLDKIGFTSGGSSTLPPQYVDIQAARAQGLTPTGSLAASTLPPAVLAEDCVAHPWFVPCDASHPPVSAYNLVSDLLADAVDSSITHGYPGEADLRAACDHFVLAGFTTTSQNPQPQACLDVAQATARIIAPSGARVNLYALADSPYKEFSTIIGDALGFLFQPRYVPSSDDSRVKYADSNGNGVFDFGEMVVYDTNTLKTDLLNKIKYFDVNNDNVFDPSEPLAYDSRLNGVYDKDELVVSKGVQGDVHYDSQDHLLPGVLENQPVIDDPRVKYCDSNEQFGGQSMCGGNNNNVLDPSEAIILDGGCCGTPDGVFDGADLIIRWNQPAGIVAGSLLTDDPLLKVWDRNHNGYFYEDCSSNTYPEVNDCVLVRDLDADGVYEKEFIISGIIPSQAGLKNDPRIKFVDESGDNEWNLYEDVVFDKNDNYEYDPGDSLISQWNLLPPDATYNTGEPLIAVSPLKVDFRINCIDLKHLDPHTFGLVLPNESCEIGLEHVVYDALADTTRYLPPDYVIRLYPSIENFTYQASNYDMRQLSCTICAPRYVDSNGNNLYDRGESVVYDANGNGLYEQGELGIWVAPLKDDPKIRYIDNNRDGVLDSGESVVYDSNLNGVFDIGETVIAGSNPSFPGGEPVVLWGTSQQKKFYSLSDIADIVLSTTTRNDWHLYSGSELVPYTPDHLYRLYHSQSSSDTCGGASSIRPQNYIFYCSPKFDQYVSTAVSTLSISSMYSAFANAALTAHRDVMTIPILSPVHRYVALNGWAGQSGQSSLVSEIGQGFHAGYGFWSLMNMRNRTGYTPSDPKYKPGAGDSDLVRRGFSGPVNTLSPFYAQTPWELEILSLVYDSLMKTTPTTGPGQIFDWMAISRAESFVDPAGGTTLKWTLRQDLRFHDGVYVTADDVVYSILAYKSLPPPRFQISLSKILSVVSIGQWTVQVKLAGQSLFYLWEIGSMPILPKHIWAPTCGDPFSPASICGSPSFDVMTTGKMIGSGPFKCANLNTGVAGSYCTRTAGGTLGTMQVTAGGEIRLSAYDHYMRGPVVRGSNLHKFSWADKNNNGKVELTEVAEAASYYGKPHPYWNNPLFGLDPTKVDIGEIATIAFYYGFTLTDPFPPGQLIGVDPVIDPFCSNTSC